LNFYQDSKDEEIIRNVAEKDEQAFYELFRRYENKVFNLVYRYVGTYHEAEEITQEIFLKIYYSAHKFRGESKFATWLYRIAVNTCKNYKRKKQPAVISIDDPEISTDLSAPASTEPEAIFAEKRKRAIIQQAIDSLAPNQKTAFILSKYEGYSYAEIAEIMKISISAVGVLLFRAKQELKKKLLPYKQRGEL